MDTNWIDVNYKLPEVDYYGFSKQKILKLNTGKYATGYWNSNKMRWDFDCLVGSKEYVIAWMGDII